MTAVCHSSPSFSSSYIINGSPKPSVPLSRRRKVLFLYHSLEVSGPAFQWACDNLLRPGYDHVTLLNTFTDEAYQIVDTKKLWKVATEEISVEVEYKKKIDRLEQELEILRLTLSELDIMAQKIILPEGDAKTNIVNMAYSLNAELIIMSSNPVTGFQRAIYGSLEDYLLRHGPCSVVVAKPRTRLARSTSRVFPSSPSSQWTSPSAEANTAVGSPVSKPLSCFVKTTVQQTPTLTENSDSLSDYISDDSSQKPHLSLETSSILNNCDKNTLGLTVEDSYSIGSVNSYDGSDESDIEATSLSVFQEQIEQYQSRSKFEIDESINDWSLQTTTKSPNSFITQDINTTVPSSPLALKTSAENPLIPSTQLKNTSESTSSKPSLPNFNSRSYSQSPELHRKPSVFFKPPPPQPRVKSIIDNLPKP